MANSSKHRCLFSSPITNYSSHVFTNFCNYESSLLYFRGYKVSFLTFPACFSIPIIFSNLNYNCSNSLDMRNLQDQVKKAICYQKFFWPLTAWNCFSNIKKFANPWPSASNYKSFSRSLEQLFLTVGPNNSFNQIRNYHLRN